MGGGWLVCDRYGDGCGDDVVVMMGYMTVMVAYGLMREGLMDGG